MLRAVIVAVVVAATLVPLVVTDSLPLGFVAVPVVIALLGLVLAWWWPAVRYRHFSYRMGQDTMELEHGVLFRTRSVIPYFRVQHVDTSQGPIDRRLSLSNLKVQTASPATDAFIPGLSTADAAEIRGVILDRAGAGDAV